MQVGRIGGLDRRVGGLVGGRSVWLCVMVSQHMTLSAAKRKSLLKEREDADRGVAGVYFFTSRFKQSQRLLVEVTELTMTEKRFDATVRDS